MGILPKEQGMDLESESWIFIGFLVDQFIILLKVHTIYNIYSKYIVKDEIRFIIIFHLGLYGFKQKTILWSITKSKWIHGPRLPYMTGIEESCATLLNRSVVMIIGMTRLNGMYQTTLIFCFNLI